jgi:hypothetical protein
MHNDARFQSTYLALVALAWESLERVDVRLGVQDEQAALFELQPELQLLRLELVQLGAKSRRFTESQLVSASQDACMQRLVVRLLGALDFDTAAAGIARMRIWHAQNWLFDEAEQWAQPEPEDRDVKSG